MVTYDFEVDFEKYFKDRDFFTRLNIDGIKFFPRLDQDEVDAVKEKDDIELAEFCYFFNNFKEKQAQMINATHIFKLFNFRWDFVVGSWTKIKIHFQYEENVKGPVIGFLGLWFDVGTGNFLIGSSDKSSGIVFFSLKDVFKNAGVFYDSNLISLLIESYKTGTLDIFDMFEGMASEDSINVNNSQVSNIILSLAKSTQPNVKSTPGTLMSSNFTTKSAQIFNEIINSMMIFRGQVSSGRKNLFAMSSNKWRSSTGFSPTKEIFNDFPGLKILIDTLTEEGYYSKSFENMVTKIRNSNSASAFTLSCLQLSAMSPKMSAYDSMGVALISNIMDLMEVADKDNEMAECFESPSESTSNIKDFFKGSVLKDYLKGARLSNLTRSMGTNIPSLKRVISSNNFIALMKAEVEGAVNPYGDSGLGRRVVNKGGEIIDNKKIFKIMGKAFDKIEKLI